MTKKAGIACSFCNKHQTEVEKIVAGPAVYICNECIALCADIAAGDDKELPAIPTLVTWGSFRAQTHFKEIPVRLLCDALPPDATVADMLEVLNDMRVPKKAVDELAEVRAQLANLTEGLEARQVAVVRARQREAALIAAIALSVVPEAAPVGK